MTNDDYTIDEVHTYKINGIPLETEDTFYCSQLAYKAYIRHGINLNTENDVPNIPFTRA